MIKAAQLLLLSGRQRPARHGDHDCVVAAQHDVDHHDLGQNDPERRSADSFHALAPGDGPGRLR